MGEVFSKSGVGAFVWICMELHRRDLEQECLKNGILIRMWNAKREVSSGAMVEKKAVLSRDEGLPSNMHSTAKTGGSRSELAECHMHILRSSNQLYSA